MKKANAGLQGDCVPCLLKNLILAYWGEDDQDKSGSGNPSLFQHEHPAMLPVHKMAERYFCCDPGGAQAILYSEKNENKSEAQKHAIRLYASVT